MGGLNRHVDLKISKNVVAGPRACHVDQMRSGQSQGVDPTEEQLSLPFEPLVKILRKRGSE